MRRLLAVCVVVVAGVGGVLGKEAASKLIEPALTLPQTVAPAPRVAITLDACMGQTDHRILDVLVSERIPATIFATKRWIDNNPDAVKTLAAHPDLFDIEDHGRNHVPAVTGSEKPYGIAPAGTLAAVDDEVNGGAEAIRAAFGRQPKWFRGATALYTPDAMTEIGTLGFRVAGFSLNADFGASASAATAKSRLDSAKDGDVVIAHINQPKRASGKGIAEGLLDLKSRGYHFVRLDELQ